MLLVHVGSPGKCDQSKGGLGVLWFLVNVYINNLINMTIPKYGVGTQWQCENEVSTFTITEVHSGKYYGAWSGESSFSNSFPYDVVHSQIPQENLLTYVPYIQIGKAYLTMRLDKPEQVPFYRKFLGDGFWAVGCDTVDEAMEHNEPYKNLSGDYITCVLVDENIVSFDIPTAIKLPPKKKPRVLNPPVGTPA